MRLFGYLKDFGFERISDPSSPFDGQVWFNASTHLLKFRKNSVTRVVVDTDSTQTLTGKTLSGNTAATLISGSGTLTLNTSGTITVPNGTDTLVGRATTDTLTNKTLSGNIATNLVSGAATITLPTVTGTLATLAGTETITNKDIDGGTASNTNRVTIPKNTKSNLDALTRKAGTIVYATDTQFAYIDNGTTLNLIGGSGGGGGALHWVEDVDSPTPVVSNFIRVYQFDAGLGQDLYAIVKVPAGYSSGNPITLRGVVYSADSSGTILMSTVATLIRTGTDAISATTNQRTSTNSAITAGAGTVNKPQSVSWDLTSSIGQINGVSVTAGDLILVQLTRGTDTATGVINVPVYGAEITLT
jgi:hypothetical protein